MRIKPFVYIQTSNKRILTNVITSFRYKFSEEEDDECCFTIESDNPMLADDPDLQEGKRLEVSWGWVDGEISHTRVIFIFDTTPDYGEEGVKIEYKCHEKFVLAKMDSVSNKNAKQLKNTPVLFSSKVISNISLEIEKGNSELKSLVDHPDINIDINSAYSKNNKGDNVVSYYNGNYSTFKNLRAFLDKLPGGPYVIDSRDEGVIIRTRDFKQDSKLTFYYKRATGNPIISFKPETKNRSNKSGSEKIDVTSWNPKNKTAVTQSVSTTDKGQVKLTNFSSLNLNAKGKDIPDVIKEANIKYNATGKTVEEMGGLPVNPKDTKTKQNESLLQNLIKRQGTGQQADNAGKDLEKYRGKTIVAEGKFPTTNQGIKKLYLGKDYGQEPAIKGVTVARDATAIAKPIYDIVVEEAKPTKSIISPEDNARALALADNERKDNELKNNPATLTVEGEPLLESGMIITILGVAVRHAGNYYIMECEHSIDDNGFKTECTKMARQGINKKQISRNKPTNTLPNSQYFYELNKPENYRWSDGDVINISKGPDTSGNRMKRVKPKIKKANKA